MMFFEIGSDLTAVTMGLDALESRRRAAAGLPDDEGLTPIYIGQDIVSACNYSDLSEVEADLTRLERAATQLPPTAHVVFLRDMIRSLTTALHYYRGDGLSFAQKVRDWVGAPTGPVDPDLIEAIGDRVDSLLDQCHVPSGDRASRIRQWEASNAIPADQLEANFKELMAQAKARTDSKIFDTGDYDMALHLVRGATFSARCNFKAGRMELNVDIRFTRAALKHLVCHEVYPGHSTQLLTTRAAVVAGRAAPDALLCTANTVAGCVQEGIGDQAAHLIDWVEDAEDELQYELRRLRSAAQTSAAWNLMAAGQSAEEVADYLRRTTAGQEAWVQGRLRMAADPFRGPFIASYWHGNECVRSVRERVSDAQRPQFIDWLYSHTHSPASLALFPLAGEAGDASVGFFGEFGGRNGAEETGRGADRRPYMGAKGASAGL